ALEDVLTGAGWKKSQVHEALYFKVGDDGVACWVLVYVDNLLAASSSNAMLKELKELLEATFELREIKPLVKYLGLEIVCDRPARKLWLHQQVYSREEAEYRQKVGSLQFAATTTRPNIAFTCSKLGSGLTVRSDNHWRELDRCLHYLTKTRDAALEFGGRPESLCLVDYADADDAGDKQNRTSTGSYVFVFGEATVSWQNVAIFDIDFDAILAAMYALTNSAEGDCYLRVPPDPGIEAAALGASASAAPGTGESAAPGAGESALSGTTPTESLHTFTLDSGALRSFFRDSTALTPLSRPVTVSLADPSGGPVLAYSSLVLPCPMAPSGLLSGLHLPSFSTNLVSGADLQDAWVDQFTPGGSCV
ncbi:unnamed protein product, partial [Closterium sp. NIES-53]